MDESIIVETSFIEKNSLKTFRVIKIFPTF